jgi:hypothetical protein
MRGQTYAIYQCPGDSNWKGVPETGNGTPELAKAMPLFRMARWSFGDRSSSCRVTHATHLLRTHRNSLVLFDYIHEHHASNLRRIGEGVVPHSPSTK